MKNLLFLIACLLTIEAPAQTPIPPMPPLPPITNSVSAITPAPKAKKAKTFTVHCPHCKATSRHIAPLAVIAVKTDVASDTHCTVITTRSFLCPACDLTFIGQARETILIPVAVEESDAPLPITPSAAIQTWTTDPDLILTIQRTNCSCSYPSNSVAISFLAKTNKLYECQASDDGAQTWLGSGKIVGDGLRHTNYERTFSLHRVYRVQVQ